MENTFHPNTASRLYFRELIRVKGSRNEKDVAESPIFQSPNMADLNVKEFRQLFHKHRYATSLFVALDFFRFADSEGQPQSEQIAFQTEQCSHMAQYLYGQAAFQAF